MKKILLFVIALATLVSCNKEKNNGRLDKTALIAINAGIELKSDNPEHCTTREILQYTVEFYGTNGGRGYTESQRDYENNRFVMFGNDVIDSFSGELREIFITMRDCVFHRRINTFLGRSYYDPYISYSVDQENRKVIITRARYFHDENGVGEDVIDIVDEIPFPEADPDFNEEELMKNHYSWRTDTIAYIPNTIMIAAEKNIREAYAEENYKKCYELFDKVFFFYPITGAEWRALKAQGVE